jgi:hypothetical protein
MDVGDRQLTFITQQFDDGDAGGVSESLENPGFESTKLVLHPVPPGHLHTPAMYYVLEITIYEDSNISRDFCQACGNVISRILLDDGGGPSRELIASRPGRALRKSLTSPNSLRLCVLA